jgi:SAM-dependent methyltransferase
VIKKGFLVLDESKERLVIDSLPVWCGVSDRAKSLQLAPFRLARNSQGLFYQDSSPEILEKLFNYSSSAYQHGTAPPSDVGMQKDRAIAFLRHVEQLCGGVVGKRILEVGAGSTFLGEYLTETAGAKSYVAVDPSISAKPKSTKCSVIREFFDAAIIAEKFDIVFSIATLEHAFDPVVFLTKARGLLANADSKIISIVPNVEPEFETGDLNAFSHEHVLYFCGKTLRQAHEASNLFVAQQYAEKRTLFLSATREQASFPEQANVHEEMSKINGIAKSFDTSATYIDSILLRTAGKKIAFYGATNGLNNLIHLLAIYDSSLPVFDSDPIKVGCYLPACDAMVRKGSDCWPNEIDVVIVSAMQFYSEIFEFLVNSQGFRPENIYPVTPVHNVK